MGRTTRSKARGAAAHDDSKGSGEDGLISNGAPPWKSPCRHACIAQCHMWPHPTSVGGQQAELVRAGAGADACLVLDPRTSDGGSVAALPLLCSMARESGSTDSHCLSMAPSLEGRAATLLQSVRSSAAVIMLKMCWHLRSTLSQPVACASPHTTVHFPACESLTPTSSPHVVVSLLPPYIVTWTGVS